MTGPKLHRWEWLVREHMEAEQARDLDRVMATLCDQPYFELHPLGYRISTWDAVEEKYRRTMAGVWADVHEDKVVGMWSAHDGGESLVVHDVAECDLRDGSTGILQALTIFDFSGDKIKGERVYMSSLAARVVGAALGDDFGAVSGVEETR